MFECYLVLVGHRVDILWHLYCFFRLFFKYLGSQLQIMVVLLLPTFYASFLPYLIVLILPNVVKQ